MIQFSFQRLSHCTSSYSSNVSKLSFSQELKHSALYARLRYLQHLLYRRCESLSGEVIYLCRQGDARRRKNVHWVHRPICQMIKQLFVSKVGVRRNADMWLVACGTTVAELRLKKWMKIKTTAMTNLNKRWKLEAAYTARWECIWNGCCGHIKTQNTSRFCRVFHGTSVSARCKHTLQGTV